MIYFFGIRLGLKLLFKGKIKSALKFLIMPINYWRTLEYKVLFDNVDFKEDDKVLDIGSPKILSLYLTKKKKTKCWATDIEDYFIKEYETIKKVEELSDSDFQVAVEDGRKLSFADESFNKVYSISVLQHIPKKGDSVCMKEISRVLKKGGKCIISVPFSPTSKNLYKNADQFYWSNSSIKENNEKYFYMRKFSEDDLMERLVKPSGLKLLKIVYLGEIVLLKSKKELFDFLHPITGPIQPLLSFMFHCKPRDSWKKLLKPLCAMVFLEKE